MTSVATGIGVAIAVGLNVATAVVQQTPPTPKPQAAPQTTEKPAPELTVTGCLVQGSAPTVFLLQHAKRDPQDANEKAASYVVVPATEDLFLKEHLNHQVRILGTPDGKPQPTPVAGRPANEKDEKTLPRLSAKGLTMVNNTCASEGGGGWSDAEGDASGDGPRHVGARKDRGGSIGLGSGGAGGFFGPVGMMSSTGGQAGGRFFNGGPYGFFGGIGFARLASTTGDAWLSDEIGADGESEIGTAEMMPWLGSRLSNFVDITFPDVPTGDYVSAPVAMNALLDLVSETTTTELLGEKVSPVDFTTPAAPQPPLVNPEPGTLLLIATGLLLVAYAGRRREWDAFRKREGR